MHTSLLLSVVVVVVAASPAPEALRVVYVDGPAVRWPWLGPSRGPPMHGSRHPPMHGSRHPPTSHFPIGDHDFYGGYGDYSDSSFPTNPVDDLSRRIMEVQRRCHDDFDLLRRLLQEQGYPMKGPQQDTPWIRFPFLPDQTTEVEEDHNTSDGFPPHEEVDYEDYFDHTHDSDSHEASEEDESNIFLDSPTPGPVWAIIPYLPEVPDADDLPDNYDNATHTILIVNGSRVEVNTTTNKETGDSITTFFHTEVINILPDEEPKEETPEEEEDTSERTLTADEDTTEEPVPEKKESTVTTTKSPEKPPVEEETRTEWPFFNHPVPAAELVAHEEMRPVRGVPSHPTTKPETHPSASYVKRPHGDPSKGKDAKPKDLSGDTLVNYLPGDTKRGKTEDPDAEIIL